MALKNAMPKTVKVERGPDYRLTVSDNLAVYFAGIGINIDVFVDDFRTPSVAALPAEGGLSYRPGTATSLDHVMMHEHTLRLSVMGAVGLMNAINATLQQLPEEIRQQIAVSIPSPSSDGLGGSEST